MFESAAIPTETHDEKTRQRLLDAAGEVFAGQGFRNATVREICKRAGANVAAVNYHFGDKERLYLAVMRYAHGYAFKKYPSDMGLRPGAPPEDRVKSFVTAFLLRVLDIGKSSWAGRLMSKELAEPTAALDFIVSEQIKPNFGFLSAALRELLGRAGQDDALVTRCAASIVGQCLFYHFGRPVLERLRPGTKIGPDQVEGLARHITAFSLAAVKALAKSNARDTKPVRRRRP
jgi:TetR/AcrR family transcriptional regulator, regulator of cefoperazone and chloramphenicol sensitivity